ncbi:MAG: VanZ family protein [Candidatus Merdivicinus sp.]|jgi:glycopeptide antibiotics resistance protein
MIAVFDYMRAMLVNMLAGLPLIAGIRWIAAIRRKKQGKTVTIPHEVGVWLFGLCLLGILSQTILPELMNVLQGIPHSGNRMNLKLFLVFRQTWDEVFRNGNPSYFFINFLGNIAVFVPLGFFPPLLWRKFQKWWKVLLFGCGISVLIELTQLLLPRGTDVDDIWLNTLGALVGYGVWKAAQKLLPRAVGKCADSEE